MKPQETINSGLEYDRLKNLTHDAETIDLEGWVISSFTTKTFKQWWSKWSLHLFYAWDKMYCQDFDPSFVVPNEEVICSFLLYGSSNLLTITLSKSECYSPEDSHTNQPINYAPPSDTPHISQDAPSLKDVVAGRPKCKPTSTKMSARKKPMKKASPSSQVPDPSLAARLLASSFQMN